MLKWNLRSGNLVQVRKNQENQCWMKRWCEAWNLWLNEIREIDCGLTLEESWVGTLGREEKRNSEIFYGFDWPRDEINVCQKKMNEYILWFVWWMDGRDCVSDFAQVPFYFFHLLPASPLWYLDVLLLNFYYY